MRDKILKEQTTYLIEEINAKPVEQSINLAEENYKNQILNIVDNIMQKKTTKFVLISGPSSSGKTTTSHILKELLVKNKITAKVISLDDFFLERDETPNLPNGDKDFDSINSIDWKLFDKCMYELQTKKASILPIYNFLTGTKSFNNSPTTLLDNEILILEGLHALNPIINNFISHTFSIKVFVCPKTSFSLNNEIQLDVFSLRLIRRLIRDIRTRGISPQTTLKFWQNVRNAENLYVLPFEKDADFIVDTTHAYEPCIYKSILQVFFVNHSEIIQGLLIHLNGFKEITPIHVPKTSVLKEFIG